MRLVNSSIALEGRVEVCHDGLWGSICGGGLTEGYVICRILGYDTGMYMCSCIDLHSYKLIMITIFKYTLHDHNALNVYSKYCTAFNSKHHAMLYIGNHARNEQ